MSDAASVQTDLFAIEAPPAIDRISRLLAPWCLPQERDYGTSRRFVAKVMSMTFDWTVDAKEATLITRAKCWTRNAAARNRHNVTEFSAAVAVSNALDERACVVFGNASPIARRGNNHSLRWHVAANGREGVPMHEAVVPAYAVLNVQARVDADWPRCQIRDPGLCREAARLGTLDAWGQLVYADDLSILLDAVSDAATPEVADALGRAREQGRARMANAGCAVGEAR